MECAKRGAVRFPRAVQALLRRGLAVRDRFALGQLSLQELASGGLASRASSKIAADPPATQNTLSTTPLETALIATSLSQTRLDLDWPAHAASIHEPPLSHPPIFTRVMRFPCSYNGDLLRASNVRSCYPVVSTELEEFSGSANGLAICDANSPR